MVKWTDHAKRHLLEIHNYIALDSPIYAERVVESLIKKTLALNLTPSLGYKTPESNDEQIREIHQYSYRILYQILPNYIAVLAVIHRRRELHPNEILRE